MASSKVPKKLKKWDKIEIFWVDSMHSSEWVREKNLDYEKEDDNYLDHKTVGYFYRLQKRAITVVQSIGLEPDDNRSTDARMTIPLVAIEKLRLL